MLQHREDVLCHLWNKNVTRVAAVVVVKITLGLRLQTMLFKIN